MPFKTPSFWYQKRGILSTLLTPVSWLYQWGHSLNQFCKAMPYQSSVLNLCVGNAIAGGGGKTPTVLALIPLLKDHDIAQNPFILTRGYGGNIKVPTLVDPNTHSAEDVGDEALLLARHAPTVICRNRAHGAKFAERNGADFILMDDGLQNKALHKVVSLLVVDRQLDFGNGKTIPAGPLREPLRKTLKKIHAVVCIGDAFHSDKPVFEAHINAQTLLDTNKKYIGFAGIGLPNKFKNTLIDMEVNLVGWHAFADHHAYSAKDIAQLKAEAVDKSATLITTEKDYVRLPTDVASDIETLPIALEFKQEDQLIAFIKERVKQA